MVAINGQLNGKAGRPPKCPDYSTCPNVQKCVIEGKCKKACTDNQGICTGKRCAKPPISDNPEQPQQ